MRGFPALIFLCAVANTLFFAGALAYVGIRYALGL